jgi:hypothetical protein
MEPTIYIHCIAKILRDISFQLIVAQTQMIIEEQFPSSRGMWRLKLFEASRMYPIFCHLPNQYDVIPINQFCAIKNETRDGFASVLGR